MAKIKLAADFSDFLKLCLRNEVRFMVIGGYAVIHHSRPRYPSLATFPQALSGESRIPDEEPTIVRTS